MITTGTTIAFIIIAIAFFLAFLRLLRGPTLPDKLAALDLMSSLIMGIILLYGVIIRQALYIDIVMIIALVLFLGTVTIAFYLKKQEKNGS